MTTEEMIQVIQAHKEGKTILAKPKGDTEAEWFVVMNSEFDFKHLEYRIKLEKKFVPYETFGEFYKAMEEHGGKFGLLRHKDRDDYMRLNAVEVDEDEPIKLDVYYYSYYEISKRFVWLDGSPCGKEIEE